MESSLQTAPAPGRCPPTGGSEGEALIAKEFMPVEFDVGKGWFYNSLRSRGISDLRLVSTRCGMHSAHVRAGAAPGRTPHASGVAQQVAEGRGIPACCLHVSFERIITTVVACIRQQHVAQVCSDLANVRHRRAPADCIARRRGFVNASRFGKVSKKATSEVPMRFRRRRQREVLI